MSNSKRGSRRQLLFRSGNFPEDRRIRVHDVAHDSTLACPTIAGRLPDGLLHRTEHRHGAAPPGDGDGLPKLFDLAEAGEAFGLELGRTQYALLHTSYDNRLYGHLTNCAGVPTTGARAGLRDAAIRWLAAKPPQFGGFVACHRIARSAGKRVSDEYRLC